MRFRLPSVYLQPAIQFERRDAAISMATANRGTYRCRDAVGGRQFDWNAYRPREQWRRAGCGQSFRNGSSAAPQISLSSTSVQFGTVRVGATGNANLLISNTGNADLTISVISVSGAAFGVHGITMPKTITAGQAVSASFTFQPTIAAAASGTLSITSNDPAQSDDDCYVDGHRFNGCVRAIAGKSDVREFWQRKHRQQLQRAPSS